MTKYIPLAAFIGLLSFGLLTLPAHADTAAGNAGAWSTVDVHQQQTVTDISPQLYMEQNAETLTTVQFGKQAAAVSHQVGHQSHEGTHVKGSQTQDLHSTADIQWKKNTWPSWTTADTSGSVDQTQSHWSNHPMWSEQYALNEQATRVGKGKSAVKSSLESETHQLVDGGIGDVHQAQTNSGATHAEGYTNPPFPKKFSFKGIGGTLRQFVNVTVENILSF